MTVNRIDNAKYAALLAETLPVVICDDAELERLTETVNRLVTKGIGENGLSPEETRLLTLLTRLIEDYERQHYAIPNAPPAEIIKHYLEARGLRQKDLLPVFGSEGIISEVLAGKRQLTLRHARQLAAFFDVSVTLFV